MTASSNYFMRVFETVRKIPRGKVATYGQIAQAVNSLSLSVRVSPQLVGWALHGNTNPEVPCHRVVNKEGKLAPNFAFNGADEQRKRLTSEGIPFRDEMHVDLDKAGVFRL